MSPPPRSLILSLAFVTLVSLRCGQKGELAGQDAGAADACGATSGRYTRISVTCAPCELAPRAESWAGAGATNCGDFEEWRPDGGTAPCVEARLDGGGPFFASFHLVGTDSTVILSVARNDAGELAFLSYDDNSYDYSKCRAGIGAARCDSIRFNGTRPECVGASALPSLQCSEGETRVEFDAGQRPLSELRCGSFPICRDTPQSSGWIPDGGVNWVCTEAVNDTLFCSRNESCLAPSPLPGAQLDAG